VIQYVDVSSMHINGKPSATWAGMQYREPITKHVMRKANPSPHNHIEPAVMSMFLRSVACVSSYVPIVTLGLIVFSCNTLSETFTDCFLTNFLQALRTCALTSRVCLLGWGVGCNLRNYESVPCPALDTTATTSCFLGMICRHQEKARL